MGIEFLFRIHRNAVSFSDKCSMDLYVRSRGTLSGTVRNMNENGTWTVPVEFNVDPIFAHEMKTLFEGVTSSPNTPSMHVSFAEAGSQFTVKSLSPPETGQEISDNARFWEKCISICEMCLYQCRAHNCYE